MLLRHQIIAPAGTATVTARLSIVKVLSVRVTKTVLIIFGFLYGGSSITNEEGAPLTSETERILESRKVDNTENAITQKNNTAVIKKA